MKIVLVGAVESTQIALQELCTAGFAPEMVVTLPPELAHRHSDFVDVVPLAKQHGCAVHFTRKSDGAETIDAIRRLDPDLVLVIGWSQLCGPEFRAVPKLGCIGFHPSDLPKLRGRAVLPWTILLQEKTIGASLFWLADGADTGDIAAKAQFEVDPDTITARALYDKHMRVLADMLPQLIKRIAAGDVPRQPQSDDGASTCALRRPEDGVIDWNWPAADIHRLIRAAGPPYPGAFTFAADGSKLVLTDVRHTPRKGYYIGIPGQVQDIDGRMFTVFCGDGNCIDILDWTGAEAPPKLHTKLGKSTT
ncbi:methionyl-tRNA formyltransferase [Aliiroseovarius halocynthiae]|uniref:Methionyl-tRNA formyltransferase n=1 Tax=Aliiroseovarius halocynthiae TaxID=985055 RepID=A0A545SUL4_9RHOB|nr:formyltransferase family protein [Aliiroseovarius halocynthiae]TQV68660.1 methionyl-tRNA formyltransferase [Aliiroseovarius halocynthiae]SMR71080.1 methionyl-tRNA formyltransferase [Aliiroseovarius halocynthiae]